MSDLLFNLVLFMLSLSVLVIIHESGHFLAARACAVRVQRFSLGFGKVLLMKRGRDGCEYVISLLPLGGYVRMQGEGADAAADGNAEGSFASRSVAQRAFIVAAGPLCNILLSVVLYQAVFMMGSTVLRPVVGDVSPHGVAARTADLAPYDEIRAVAGRPVSSWQEVVLALAEHAGSAVSVQVAADFGRAPPREVVLSLSGLELGPRSSVLGYLGIRACQGVVHNELEFVAADSPAGLAGLRPGDRIVAVDAIPMESFYRLADYISEQGPRPLEVAFIREGQRHEVVITPELRSGPGAEEAYRIGVAARTERIAELYTFVSYPFAEAASRAAAHTCDMSLLIVRQLLRMLRGLASADSLSGPIAIARGAAESAALGLTFYMAFLALISVNLGILNLLPIPVLDGGQLLFLAYETVFRRRPSAQAQWVLTVLGFALLMMLTVFALINDLRAL